MSMRCRDESLRPSFPDSVWERTCPRNSVAQPSETPIRDRAEVGLADVVGVLGEDAAV